MGDGHRFRYPRSARLRRGPDIRALLREGSRRRCGPLEVYRSDSPTRSARVGIIVPRYGHTIVQRNVLKRRLREFVRLDWLPAAQREVPAPDVLVRVRPAAYQAEAGELRAALGRCLGGKG